MSSEEGGVVGEGVASGCAGGAWWERSESGFWEEGGGWLISILKAMVFFQM